MSSQGNYQHQSTSRQPASCWTAARSSCNGRSTAGQDQRTLSQRRAAQNTQGQRTQSQRTQGQPTPEPARDALSAINPDNQVG